MILPPAPPYRGPAKFHGGDQSPLTRVVIHGTVSPTQRGGAEAIARYFRVTVTRPSSAHYVVDPFATRQVVFDHTEAYGAPPNLGAIHVELCDPVSGDPARWNDVSHRLMLRRAAYLTARLCLAYGIPLVKIGPDQLRAGEDGVCGHIDVTNAWHQTTHTDPGPGFPWGRFMAMAHRRAVWLRCKERARQALTPR